MPGQPHTEDVPPQAQGSPVALRLSSQDWNSDISEIKQWHQYKVTNRLYNWIILNGRCSNNLSSSNQVTAGEFLRTRRLGILVNRFMGIFLCFCLSCHFPPTLIWSYQNPMKTACQKYSKTWQEMQQLLCASGYCFRIWHANCSVLCHKLVMPCVTVQELLWDAAADKGHYTSKCLWQSHFPCLSPEWNTNF